MIVGITGGYCSGKSCACSIFSDYGFRIIDVDKVGHEALDLKKDEIIKVFGKEIVEDDKINRKALGRIVFNSKEQKKKLELIVHPWMIKRVKELLKNEKNVVIDAALLIEMCLFTLCDYVVFFNVEEDVAVKRGMERDNITMNEALKRIKAQAPLKEKLPFVDKIIDNNNNIDHFKDRIINLLNNLKVWKM